MEEILAVPPFLKAIRPYIKVGIEIFKRDPVVSYHCYYYAMKAGLKTNYKQSPEAKQYLTKLMDYQETIHSDLKVNPDYAEGLTDDMTGQACVEEAAMKLFAWADSQDRNKVFNKQVVKSFYTASVLFDVMTIFNEPVSEESKTQQKYARWKATYIHNCLKNNQTPVSGPIGGDEEDDTANNQVGDYNEPSTSYNAGPSYNSEAPAQPTAAPRKSAAVAPEPAATQYVEEPAPDLSAGSSLTHKDFQEAEKMCKYAGSALQYKDVKTATELLEKCLRLLKTGHQ